MQIGIMLGCILNFYPRSPCGERPAPQQSGQYDGLISIHALLAESDETYVVMEATKVISIHALLAESDDMPMYGTGDYEHFYPRSPCGERLRVKGQIVQER